MKLYGFWRSLATYRVRVTMALKGVKAEEISIDLLKGKQHAGDYLAVNPQGVVPALIRRPRGRGCASGWAIATKPGGKPRASGAVRAVRRGNIEMVL